LLKVGEDKKQQRGEGKEREKRWSYQEGETWAGAKTGRGSTAKIESVIQKPEPKRLVGRERSTGNES